MQAVVLTGFGGPEVLELGELADPRPAPGEVVVEVVAAGVNRADLLQRQGHYPPPPGAPQTLGLECSGRVTALGSGVSRWQVGDRCCALLAGGGYAEQVAVPAGQLMPPPAGVDLATAAALPEAAATVWTNVFAHDDGFDDGLAGSSSGSSNISARLAAGLGVTLLVHGGGSGIGTMAIQLAVASGCRVLCTVGTDAKAEFCARLGALPINHRTERFPDRVAELTGGRGADVILDIIGARYLAGNLASLAVGGRLVVIGLQGGRTGELDLSALQRRQATITATTLRARSAAQKAVVCRQVVAHVWPLVEQGRVRPIVADVLDLAEAARAHRILEESNHIGKVLLRVAKPRP